MDGLFELLIILAIFVLPALEAWAKKRRRAERREEGGGGVPSPAPPDDRAPGWTPDRERDGGRGRARAEESAEVLLPEDLWEELTGERRRAEAEAGAGPEAAGGEVEAPRWGAEGTSPERTAPETPLPDARVEAEPAPWRETGRAESEPGAADLGGRMGSGEFGWSAGAEAPTAEEPAEEAYRGEEPRRADVLRGVPTARPRTHRSRIAEIGRLRPGRAARRGAGPAGEGDLHPLIGDLDRKALRRAVVYAEILGPPVSQRGE